MSVRPSRPARRTCGSAAAWVLAVLAPLAGCDGGRAAPAPPADPGGAGARPGAAAAKPAAAPAAVAALPTFTEIADAAGLVVENHTGKPAQKDWIVSAMGGGTCAFDYDGDGDMDILVVDGTMLTAEGVLEHHDHMRTRLFRNDSTPAGMKFTEVTKAAGIDIQSFGFGGAACDYDGDGHTDFYVCAWGRNFLMRNRGDGTFEDVTERTGTLGDLRDMSTACAWGDVDGDGRIDLYVANYCDQRALIEEYAQKQIPGRSATWRELKVYVGPAPVPPQKDRLYLQNADGTFREVTDTNLRDQRALYGFQAVMSDVDNDGDLDIFVANDTQSNHLWVNDGKGVFQDRSVAAGVAMNQDTMEQACMGVDVGDYNRDGWMDITVTNFSHDYNTIYLNRTGKTGVLSFTDSSSALGIAQPSYLRLAWGVRFVDYDNDGFLDHMTACGHVYGEIANFAASTGTSFRQRCQLLRNGGPSQAKPWRLEDVTDRSGPAFTVERVWRGICFGDFDDDGDMDAFVAALNDKAGLFRNDGGNANAFLRFRLAGKGGLRDPAGVRVHVTMPDGTVQVGEVHDGDSFCSDSDPRVLIGMGSATVAPKVEVVWRDGSRQSFTNVATRTAWIVEQGAAEMKPDRLLAQ